MDINQLNEQHEAINKEIDHRLDIRREIRQQIADTACPFVVGDKIQDGKVNKAVVRGIRWSHFRAGYKVKVSKIKKNGEPYAVESEAWNPEKWSKL